MSQSRVKQVFRNERLQKVYEDYITTDRDPLVPGSDGLSSAFHRGFMLPSSRSVAVRDSLAYAAWAAGRDRRRQVERVAKAAGISVVPQFNLGNGRDEFGWSRWSGKRLLGQSECTFGTDAAAWVDAARAVSANVISTFTPASPPDTETEHLRKLLHPGSTVYTIRRHMTRTGGSQELSLLIAHDGRIVDLTRYAALALNNRVGDHKGMILYNVGADLGAQVVGLLGHKLYPDAPDKGFRSFVQEWL